MGVRGELAGRPDFRGMAGAAAARRREWFGQGRAARLARQRCQLRVAEAGGQAGVGGRPLVARLEEEDD